MSLLEGVFENLEEINKQVQKIQDQMKESPTGNKVIFASILMSSSDKMTKFMEAIGAEADVSEEKRLEITQYMMQQMQQDPAGFAEKFQEYLEEIVKKPENTVHKDYYDSLAKAAIEFEKSKEYQAYVKATKAFDEDDSPEAMKIKQNTIDTYKKIAKIINPPNPE